MTPAAPSRDLTTPVGTSFQIRKPRQQTPRVRSDRVVSVSEHVWVSMETDRIDRRRFGSVVALPDDALVKGAKGVVSLSDGDYVAVQIIPSSDLPMFVNRAVDGMSPSPGDFRNIRGDTSLVCQDEKADKTNLRNRLSVQSAIDEDNPFVKEPPDFLRTLWVECDAHGDRHKAWREFTHEATFETSKD